MRVERTFAFLDLCGFTAYTEAEGDDAAVVVLARLRAALRAASEERGVRITKWLGDGVMLSGLDPRCVAACAVDAVDRIATSSPLALRGGLARGEVIMFEGDDYVGAAVNTAARLCRAAKPNRLLVAATVLGDGEVAAAVPSTRRHVALEGIADPVLVVELPTGFADCTPQRTVEMAV
jgi:adenylate cyclase